MMGADPKVVSVRTIEDVHRDIALANSYRQEFIKHMLSLATAVFVFTISFKKGIIGDGAPRSPELAACAWALMAISIMGGIAHLAGWDRFYISFRDHDYPVPDGKGKGVRQRISFWRRVAMWCQIVGFFGGVPLIAAFVIVNLW